MKCLFGLLFLGLIAGIFAAPLEVEESEDVGEYGDLYQGDILLPAKRNGVSSSRKRWSGGVIPYVIYSSISSSGRSKIAQAVSYYKSKTCIKFVPRTNQRDYVAFKGDSSGCFSMLGKNGGRQTLNLAKNCFNSFGTVLHEMMHAIGFHHEQAREDRDKYVTIHWNNIQSNRRSQFDIAKGSKTYGTRYDMGSVMHYSSKAFSTNGQYTITPKSGSVSQLGQRSGLSSTDLRKIKAMYGC